MSTHHRDSRLCGNPTCNRYSVITESAAGKYFCSSECREQFENWSKQAASKADIRVEQRASERNSENGNNDNRDSGWRPTGGND